MARTGRPVSTIGTYGSISASRRGKGWQASTYFRDSDGKSRRVRATGKTKGEAIRILKDRLLTREPVTETRFTRETSLAEVTKCWLEQRSNLVAAGKLKASTVEQNRFHGRQIIDDIGQLRLRECTTRRMESYLQGIAVEKPTQARLVRIALRGVMSVAALEITGFVNPIRETTPIPRKRSAPKAFTPEEIAELREILLDYQTSGQKGHERGVDLPDILTLFMATGARIGELLALRWQDVHITGDDAADPYLVINGTLVQVAGKGLYRQDTPKSEDSVRRCNLPPWAAEMLRVRLYNDPTNLEHGIVFPSRAGTFRSPNNVRSAFRRALKGTKFEGGLHPHMFRATVATALKRASSTELAAAQLGHSSPTITLEYYIAKDITGPQIGNMLDAFAPA